MAQTKRKRRTKHRGTAAGVVTQRGRTGRPPTADERKKQTREQARVEKLNKPPTWNSSVKRAGLASGFMFLFLLVTGMMSKGGASPVAAVLFAVFAFALYVPAGYYLETLLFRRRQRKKAAAP